MDGENVMYVSMHEFNHRCNVCGSYIKHKNNVRKHERSKKHKDAKFVTSFVIVKAPEVKEEEIKKPGTY